MASIFTRHLLQWHATNPRPLAWSSHKKDPYRIWISEIIMQQTRVEQGTPYYLRFIERFPNIKSLAEASADDVLHAWQGLGYYTRARNLHAAAQKIQRDFKGHFPATYDDILSLPGVGPYSAAAIASFAFGLPYPVVDGNVKRVIARFNGLRSSIDEPSTHEEIRHIADEYIPKDDPGTFNQAIMNFGALMCTPKSPACPSCPLHKQCFAFQHNLVEQLPVRKTKKSLTDRFFHFVVVHYKDCILLEKRKGKDIWHGLYAPLLLERKSSRKVSEKLLADVLKTQLHFSGLRQLSVSETTVQLLSHQRLHARFYHFSISRLPGTLPDNFVMVSYSNLNQYGKPKMIVDHLEG